MDSHFSYTDASGGSNILMVGKIIVKKKKKKIDASQPDPSKLKFAKVLGRERGEVEAISARSELHQRGLVSAKQAKEGFEIKGGKLVKKEIPEVLLEGVEKRDLIEESGGMPPTAVKPVDEKILTETITFTDATGFTKEIQMPIGTSAKIAEANARREGRVPFSELPEYQQFLAATITTGTSARGLISAGKLANTLGKPLTKFMTSTLGKYIGATIVGSGIITWLASDNIIGTMSIYTRDLAEDVTFGKISKQEALDKIDEGDAFVEKASNFIKTATTINPTLWPFRSIILANVDAARLAIEENKNRIRRA